MSSILPAPHTGNPVRTTATADTIELFLPWPPSGLRKQLVALATGGGGDVHIEDVVIKGRYRGTRVAINRPNRGVLAYLLRLLADRRLHACVHRVDIAVDFSTINEFDADELARWLDRRVILKWRSPRGRKRHCTNHGAFWVVFAGNHAPRDLCVYRKGENKVRAELRFQNAASVRRAGLDELDRIEDVDVSKLFEHNIKAAKLTDRFIAYATRRAVKEEMTRHQLNKRRSDHDVVDYYRSRIAHRARQMLSRADMQELRKAGKTDKIDLNWLKIPDRVVVPEKREAVIESKGEIEAERVELGLVTDIGR